MPETVGVTLLFTDLVGSTALASSMTGAEAEQLRTQHFALLRRAVEAHGGREVKNLGDGIMAAFAGATAALDAAVTMQQAVADHNRVQTAHALAVRIGVATGDCTHEDDDYFGEPVVQAARLCAAAEGHQILATSVLGFLVPRDAHDLRPVGDLELKGLPEPLSTVEVMWSPLGPATTTIPLPARLAIQTGLSPLVGRAAEREVLDSAAKTAASGDRRVVLVTGEAGLGKTRLTTEFACDAHQRGAVVLYGRCDEELAVPYLPWVECLAHCVSHVDQDLLDRLPGGSRAVLARLLPGVRDRLGVADDDAGGSVGDQYVLFGAVTALIAELALAQPVVLVLDDLHWADRGSLQLLRHVTMSLPSASLLVVGTYRETDLGTDDPLTETSAQLHREPGVQRMPLSGLSDVEVLALLEGAAGHELDDDLVPLAHALRTDSAGNPFFVVEVIRHLVETGSVQRRDGRWTVTAALEELALPQSVRDVVGQRVRRLDPDAHTILTAAAVVGREFETAVIAGATDFDEDRVLDVLEEAMAAGLVAEVAGAVDRFSFTHALVQHTLYSELSESRRARMHRRVATCIEALVGDRAGERAGELAKHWFAAVRPAELDRAVSYAIEAASHALERSAPDEAVRWFTEALAAVEDDQARCELLVRLGDAERQAGIETYRERLLGAAADARRIGRGDLLVAAALANYRGFHSASGEIDHERVVVLEAALAQPQVPPADRARLLATLAGELTYSDQRRRFDMAREAEQLGEAEDDPSVLLDALERVGSSLNVPEMLPERTRRGQRMMELTSPGTDPLRRFLALEHQTDVHLTRADMESARRCAQERRAIAEQLGQPTCSWLATHGEALLDLVEGDVDAALAGAQAAFELGTESGQPDLMVYFGAVLMQVHMHRHAYAEIIPAVRERLAANPGWSAFRAVLVNFLVHAGEREEAAQMLEDMAAGHFAFDRDVTWLSSMVLSSEAAARLGDAASTDLLRGKLLPFAGQVVSTRAHCLGPVAYYLGIADAALGDTATAEHRFRAAVELTEGLRSPFHRSRALVELAKVLQPTDPAAAAEAAREVLALDERYGLPGQAEQARALAV